MKIPLLDLKPEYEFLKKDIDKQLKSCLSSQQWVLGPKVKEFERKAAKYLGINYAVGVASGTDALLIGLRALALSLKKKEFFNKEDEIITTPFSFVATAEAIVRSGAKPVFVDIDPDSFNIDPEKIKKAITKNTVGIIPVHLYGKACRMKEIKKIAKANKLFIIEDCAQSFGTSFKGKKTGSLGDLGAFSFFPSKNLGGFGDGGLITAKTKKYADLIKVLRNHGQTAQYKADYCGYNSRLDSIQAAILLAKLKHIDKFNKKRIQIAQKYNNAFQNISQIQTSDLLDTRYSIRDTNFSHVYHLYTIKLPAKIRPKFISYLNSKGISARSYYPVSLDKMKAFKTAKVPYKLKNTNKVMKEVVSLPIYPFMDNRKVEYVINQVNNFFKNNQSIN
ncbi:MAG: DegT/DnrJ/EryC1/StrS family aminotransferase [Candidatus Omnitrophica bacterium]|nr:DegT/DnrJ/EryC1/StrS family aminotransferase [Candidatus Omnitrophota bacterium]